MSFIIGADFVPTKSNIELCNQGNADDLFGVDLKEVLLSVDYRIFNLETPITDRTSPIKKCGPNLSAPVSSINIFKVSNVNLLTLANNHILDQGVIGLKSTIEVLKEASIATVGAGQNIDEAKAGYVIELNGKKIGVYGCVEHEFSTAGFDKAGANPFDPFESFDHIRELSQKCDFVIVLYHGGKEYYRYPSPILQKTCRKFVECGANLVVCQHSHCIGCEEKYNDATIVYGQGNFLFDGGDNEFWNSSLLIYLDDEYKVDYIPLCKSNNCVRLADEKESTSILKGFKRRSKEILSPGFIEERYHEFSLSMIDTYFSKSIGRIRKNYLFRGLNKLARNSLVYKCFDEDAVYSLMNAVECEAHRELFIDGLKQFAIQQRNRS